MVLGAAAPPLLCPCPPSEFPGNLKARALLFMMTISFFRGVVCLSPVQFMCCKSLAIQHGGLVTDVNDRSVQIVIQRAANPRRRLAARHAPDLWLSGAPAAAPAHPTGPPCTRQSGISKKWPPSPITDSSERPALLHVMNSKRAAKKFVMHFFLKK